ncbi:MAG: hypothetical protein RLY86_3578 [Pseudomonadota bacterium]|jgi:predicted lipid-binding transport protein (Tim44 family)
MGEGFFLDILIFAMVAAFLVYRLRSVLGRRHGEERQRPNPLSQRQQPPAAGPTRAEGDNVVQLPGRAPAEEVPAWSGPVSLEEGLKRIHQADPSFNERHFLQGARAAFEMIVKAYADGETATLRPLLADEVYDRFAEAIRQRQAAGETLETRIEKFESVDLAEARMEGNTAFCTVRFTTHQVNVTVDRDGSVVDGDADDPAAVIDLWTFSRNTRSGNPNWALAETRSATL